MTNLRAFDQLAETRRKAAGTPLPQLPLAQIAPLPGQPRQHFDAEALAELAESIKTHGVIQPIIVIAKKDALDTDPVRYAIVCGERRFQAAAMAGLTAIPALIRDYDDDEVAVLALLENLQREDLTPLEEGEYLFQLKQKYGFTEEQLGERLGKSRDYVHMRTRLLSLRPEILKAWREPARSDVFTTLTPSHAIVINQLEDALERDALTQAVVTGGLTVAEIRRRLALLKALESEGLPAEPALKLREAALRGVPDAEFAMRLASVKKRLEPRSDAPAGPDPRLATDDLATFRLFAEAPEHVTLSALEAALKKDLAWVRKLRKDLAPEA